MIGRLNKKKAENVNVSAKALQDESDRRCHPAPFHWASWQDLDLWDERDCYFRAGMLDSQ